MAKRVSDSEISEMRRLRQEGMGLRKIADRLGRSVSTVHGIVREVTPTARTGGTVGSARVATSEPGASVEDIQRKLEPEVLTWEGGGHPDEKVRLPTSLPRPAWGGFGFTPPLKVDPSIAKQGFFARHGLTLLGITVFFVAVGILSFLWARHSLPQMLAAASPTSVAEVAGASVLPTVPQVSLAEPTLSPTQTSTATLGVQGSFTPTVETAELGPSPLHTMTLTPTPKRAPTAVPFQGSREPVNVPARPAPFTPKLVDVRTGRHLGFDRVVFEFVGAVPGYRVEYVQPPILGDASGLPVDIASTVLLRVRFFPAAAHDDSGQATFGMRELSPGFSTLLEVKQAGDFEGVLTWVLGLSRGQDFAVYELTNPFRIVIDVAA